MQGWVLLYYLYTYNILTCFNKIGLQVLITLYWLGRKAYADPFYNGPYLKLKAFKGLLGTTLYKVKYVCFTLWWIELFYYCGFLQKLRLGVLYAFWYLKYLRMWLTSLIICQLQFYLLALILLSSEHCKYPHAFFECYFTMLIVFLFTLYNCTIRLPFCNACLCVLYTPMTKHRSKHLLYTFNHNGMTTIEKTVDFHERNCRLYVCPSHSRPCAPQAIEDYTSLQGSARNGSCGDSWYSEKEELLPLTGHKREDSLDSLDSLDSRTCSTFSDTTLKGSSEGKMLSFSQTLQLALSCVF